MDLVDIIAMVPVTAVSIPPQRKSIGMDLIGLFGFKRHKGSIMKIKLIPWLQVVKLDLEHKRICPTPTCVRLD
jgi:hypothetical protein